MRRSPEIPVKAALAVAIALVLTASLLGCRCTPAEEPAGPSPGATPTPSVEPTLPDTSTAGTATPTEPETEAPGADPGAPSEEPRPTGQITSFSTYLAMKSKIQPVSRTLPRTPAPLRLALTELLQGPEPHERRAGLSTAIPPGTQLRGLRVTDGIAVIDLSDEFSVGGGGPVRLRYAQLTFTATQYPTVRGVRVLVDGRPAAQLGAGLTGRPLRRADFESETPAILIDSPSWGSELARSPVTMKGTANVFEANFQLWVFDGDGRRVFSNFVQATSGTGSRGTWERRIDLSRARPGVGRVRVFEYSAENGEPINRVDVRVNIR